MYYRLIIHSIGNVLSLLALTMIFPVFWSIKDHSSDLKPLLLSIVITLIAGSLMRLFKPEGKFGRREGFVIVGIGWILIVAFGALPLYFSGAVPSYTDAYFEIMSGFTTTGATVIGDVESLGRGIVFWRSLTVWIGGMGIIVLSLAIFALFGGGASLFHAEVPSIIPEKIMPRLKQTAMALWGIYSVISLLQVIALKLAGLSIFDSLVHTFSAMGTGGFSSRNISIEAYHSLPVEMILVTFMILAGLNFSLYYRAVQRRSLKAIFTDPEAKGYLSILTIATVLITGSLALSMKLPVLKALRYAVFQVVSICTTTGFSSNDFAVWPPFAQALLFLLMFIGGCAGSTAGALKVARVILLFKYMKKQIMRIARPRLMIQAKLGETHIQDSVIHEILAFFFMYVLLFVIGGMVLTATGVDLVSAFSASAATLGNIGPGLAIVGPLSNYGFLHPIAKWTLSFLMLAGRLEILTVLVMFSPSFWKR
ncbi:MAG TPA: TrkH family potassium uptake protein [Bacillota bacterium]|nr:TrkH family potassium uptake protein [Bacillota bacterium]